MLPFHKAIAGKDRIKIIAELKRSSPSHGTFPNHDVIELMNAYEQGGASAISVVTEKERFGGSMELLQEVRRATKLPILRKDFITELQQINETSEAGANAVLLIVRNLKRKKLETLVMHAHKKQLDAVVEIHNETDLEKISGLKDVLVGINNRNLTTFTTDVRHAETLISSVNPCLTIIAESAFSNLEELSLYKGRIDAVLIGTALLIAKNPLKKLNDLTLPC